MADKYLRIRIPEGKVQKVVQAFNYNNPSPATWNEETGQMEPDFTPAGWVKEQIKRWIVQRVNQAEMQRAIDLAAANQDPDPFVDVEDA